MPHRALKHVPHAVLLEPEDAHERREFGRVHVARGRARVLLERGAQLRGRPPVLAVVELLRVHVVPLVQPRLERVVVAHVRLRRPEHGGRRCERVADAGVRLEQQQHHRVAPRVVALHLGFQCRVHAAVVRLPRHFDKLEGERHDAAAALDAAVQLVELRDVVCLQEQAELRRECDGVCVQLAHLDRVAARQLFDRARLQRVARLGLLCLHEALATRSGERRVGRVLLVVGLCQHGGRQRVEVTAERARDERREHALAVAALARPHIKLLERARPVQTRGDRAQHVVQHVVVLPNTVQQRAQRRGHRGIHAARQRVPRRQAHVVSGADGPRRARAEVVHRVRKREQVARLVHLLGQVIVVVQRRQEGDDAVHHGLVAHLV